jgi:hypothetical protein
VLRDLRDQNRFGLYCALAGATAFGAAAGVGSIASISLDWIAAQPEAIPRRNLPVSEPSFWVMAILIAPPIETMVFRWLLAILTSYLRLPLALGFASLLAGAAHGPYPIAFLATSSSFFVYAVAWHHWKNVSTRKSYWAPATAHIISNSLVALSALFTSSLNA